MLVLPMYRMYRIRLLRPLALEGPKCISLRQVARQPIFDRDVAAGRLLPCSMSCSQGRCPTCGKKFRWIPKQERFFAGEPGLLRPIYQWMLARESGEWETARSICDSPRLTATSWPHLVLAGPTVGPRSLQGPREVSGLFGYRASALDLHKYRHAVCKRPELPIRSRRPEAA